MTSRSHEEEDSDKSGLASGGCEQERTLTTKEQKLLDALRELNMDPQTESREDIGLFVRRLTKKTDEERKPRSQHWASSAVKTGVISCHRRPIHNWALTTLRRLCDFSETL
ncbi:uncharacterized protein LOC127867463 [Dreissena polymorpha]|uniref:uncharacterized protein LOC127867463 n=1 Tax=Dreissena polymorpha TaxID=45954 RepID=UPI0022653C67|nr:uncharacterized protein LOC127867463 [Dreissena polymorpha]